jgi:hypothetical protein
VVRKALAHLGRGADYVAQNVPAADRLAWRILDAAEFSKENRAVGRPARANLQYRKHRMSLLTTETEM